MIAGTRTWPELTLRDVDSSSTWTNGFPWMTLKCSNFPIQTIDKIKHNQQEIATIWNEIQEKEVSQQQIITLDQNIEERIYIFNQHYHQ